MVGLASYGQATYETEYNGGMGSNGLTSARHDVFAKGLATKYPESFDPAVPCASPPRHAAASPLHFHHPPRRRSSHMCFIALLTSHRCTTFAAALPRMRTASMDG